MMPCEHRHPCRSNCMEDHDRDESSRTVRVMECWPCRVHENEQRAKPCNLGNGQLDCLVDGDPTAAHTAPFPISSSNLRVAAAAGLRIGRQGEVRPHSRKFSGQQGECLSIINIVPLRQLNDWQANFPGPIAGSRQRLRSAPGDVGENLSHRRLRPMR